MNCKLLLVPTLVSLTLAACGNSADPQIGGGRFAPRFEPPSNAKSGGELKVLDSSDIGPVDPGAIINQASYMVNFATQRTLLSTGQGSSGILFPDLASKLPKVDTKAGRVLIHIRPDVFFSPPVNRAVKAADVKYAIERALMPAVANGDVEADLGELVGYDKAAKKSLMDTSRAPDISGIKVIGKDSLELRFNGPVPPLTLPALTLSFTSPVPSEYARQFDEETPSRYGSHVVATGPYMVEADEEGNVTGYKPDVEIRLVRNPNWHSSSDFRPAFLDSIVIESGYTNIQVASDTVLGGSSMIGGDFGSAPAASRSAAQNRPDQLMIASSPAELYASLNTTIPPFDDVNVRRAILAASDRKAMSLAHGGTLAGTLATHFLPPGIGGFEQAGGYKGPGFDFLADPDGDASLAASYMRKAGYASGSYDGEGGQVMVTDNTSVGRRIGEIVRQALSSIGIEVEVKTVSRDTMYSSFCNVPRASVAVCPNVGWVGLAGDGQLMLEPTFSGKLIRPINNSNWPQLNVPSVNRLIARASQLSAGKPRSEAWAKADRAITDQAPAIPIVWPKLNLISSANVLNVIEPGPLVPALPMISLKDSCTTSGGSC